MGRRGEYRLVLSADGRLLRQEVQKSKSDLKDFEGAVKKTSDELKKLGQSAAQDMAGPLGRASGAIQAMGPAGLAAAAGLGALVGGITAVGAALASATKAAVTYGGNIADMAAKNGMGVESFQAVSQGLDLTSVSMEQAQKAIRTMQLELVKSPAKFRELGLEVEKLRAMDPADAFLETAKAVAAIQDPAARAAAEFEVFKKAGIGVAGAMAQMGDAAERAKALGNVMSADVVAGLDKTGDAAQTFQTTWEHLWLNLGAAIGTAPGVAESIDKITDAIGQVSTMIQENQPAIQALIKDVFPAVAGAAVLVANGIITLVSALQQLKAAWDVQVPAWAKGFLTGGASNIVDFLKEAGGVTPGPASRVATNMAARKPALVGPGVGRKRTSGGSAGRGRGSGAREETEAIREMANAMKAAKRDSDAFWAAQEKGASNAAKAILDQINLAHKTGAGVLAEEEAKASEKGAQVLDDLLEQQREAEEQFRALIGSVYDAANGFDFLGQAIGGAMGEVLKFVGSTIGGLGQIAENIKSFKSAGGGLTGLLGKVGAGLGIAGTAFSVGKALVGGIGKLFGFGKKKEEKPPVKTLAEQFSEVQKAAEKAGTVGSKALRDIITQARSAKEKTAEVEAFVKGQIGNATGAMGGITGTLKDGKVTGGIAITTPEGAKAQATIFTSTFWAAVKEQGLVAGVDALQAPFEALREKLTAGGFDAGALLGGVGGIFDAVGGPDSPVRAALEGADALKAALEGVANAGYLTAESFSAFQTSAQDAFNQAVAGGLSSQEALRSMAPLLGSIISASNEYGIAIDENTQALIDQAKEAGVAFPADPILQMRDAVRELVNEIRTLNGLPQREWGEGPTWAPGGGMAIGPGIEDPQKYGAGDIVSAARGLRPTKLRKDTVIQAHAGETAMIVPKGQPVAFRSAAAGLGTVGPVPASDSGGGFTYAPNINITMDTIGDARTREKFKEELFQAAAAGVRLGTNPLVKAFQDRGSIR